MKNLTQLLFTLFCLCLPAMLQAQDKDDSKYLAGAVPEVDGKVVFTKEFSIPGMSQDEIYERLLGWMDARLKENENTSRVVFSDKEKGQIVGIGDEWIVFSSTALSLDRTKILYQLTVTCQPEKSVLEVEKIRFNYREGKEKYTAEEWIVDKYALNKAKTKLVRGLAKWRRKTVDFVDDLCLGAAEALSATTAKAPVEEKKEEKKKPSGSFSEVWEKRGQETDAANDFRKKIEMEITEARPGYAVGEIVLKPWHMNILGIVHGGVLYSLADTVGGTAAMTGRDYAVPTVDGTIHYLKAGKNTSKIIARAQEIQNSYAFSVCECKIYDDKETLLTSATMTYYHLRKR